ncbi:MAG: hypothetical protein PWQ27_1552 [Kosmotoga sp.]|jgi:NAD-dependent SIR2 family protein deacetylase|nr:hypothetical protein [Kosmotoga sp.]
MEALKLMIFEREIDDVVESLRNAKIHGRKTALLIGTGCSAQAGVPTAAKVVDMIKETRPLDYERAPKKTYSKCMSQLAPGERRDLIANFTDETKVNWAHIVIAQLMKSGYVDRILTTNFDSLVIRACALLGEFPAVYDLTTSANFKPDFIPDKAVFYLHGQRTGFELINTEKEFEEHVKRIEPAIMDTARGRMWIVVGYSGRNDPVFDHLAKFQRFDYRLYWVGYKDSEPPKHVQEKLLQEGKYAFYIRGYDADSFFVKLAQKLDCFPPDFVSQPFSYLQNLLSNLTPCPLSENSKEDVVELTKEKVKKAIELFEE